MIFECAYCGVAFAAKPTERQYGRVFCSSAHYHAWRLATSRFDREDRHRDYNQYKRQVWGGSGRGAKEVGAWARPFGATFEQHALAIILPAEGFTEIDDWSGHSNQFVVDFIATKDDERVLVDVTSKWQAYVREKARLATSLRMRLFILHVSPADSNTYWLGELPPGRRMSKVPMSFFHTLHDRLGHPIKDWPDKEYRVGARVERVQKQCETCGAEMAVPVRLANRKRFCSRRCQGIANVEHLNQKAEPTGQEQVEAGAFE